MTAARHRRRTRRFPTVTQSPMADVAFLLLVFFLVVASIDSESGIPMTLPRAQAVPPPPGPGIERLEVRLAADGTVLADGAPLPLQDLRGAVAEHALGGRRPLVSYGAARAVPYARYLAGLDAVHLGYADARDRLARSLGAAGYPAYRDALAPGQPDRVREHLPVRISLSEPPAPTLEPR